MASTAYDWLSDLNQLMNKNSGPVCALCHSRTFSQRDDPHIKGWPFMENPLPLIILSICYVYFASNIGPRFMKNRKPYNLKTAITVYNTCQILACIYLIYGFTKATSFSFLTCELTDTSLDINYYKIAKLLWWAVVLKFSEYIETVFFVLRKKQNQVSGLHLYHHVSTLSFAWLTSKFSEGPIAVIPIIINSFIHILMYTYYMVALHTGKEFQKKIIPWKRSLTILQMVQFTIVILHLLNGLKSDCAGSRFLRFLMLSNIFILYFLFYKFYKNTYTKSRKTMNTD